MGKRCIDGSNLPTNGTEVSVNGFKGFITRSLRTANGLRLTVDVPDVESVDAGLVDASTIGGSITRTTGTVGEGNDGAERQEVHEDDAHRASTANSGAAPQNPTGENPDAPDVKGKGNADKGKP